MSRDDNKDGDRTESMGGFDQEPDRPRIERLGPFKIEATLGSGGMGTIYRAYDESMKRPVALKVLHSSLEISERAQSRFVREAWIAGQLDHPNIIKVFSRGEENRVSYLALELAEGGSLSDLVEQTRESIPSGSDVTDTVGQDYIKDILAKFVELTDALEHIHSKGFIHRDIKPQNVLLSGADKKFKLTDFGIAHAKDMTRMTQAGDFIGTVRYMSPELLAAHRAGIDKRTDIYSLGVTLYEALTLTLPFKADSEEKLIGEILAGHCIEARKVNRRIPVDLETVLMKACNHDPDLRYQTAAEFADDLQRIIDGRPVLARRPSLPSRGLKYVRRNYRAVLAVTAATVVVLATVFWSFYRTDRADDPEFDKPAFAKIEVPGCHAYCALSLDGEKLAFVADDSCLWVARTHGTADASAAGDPIRLTESIVDRTGWGLPIWSADGKWIAFNGRLERDEISNKRWFSMFVVQSLGGELIEIPVKHNGSGYWANFRISLSPDGQTIAFSSHTSPTPGESKTDCIYSIPVGGGEVKRLTDTLCRQPAYSPNGEMLAYVKGYHGFHNDGSEQSEIWVVPAEGGTPILVSDIPGVLFSPIWSPDSRSIAFGRWRDHADAEGDWAVDELYIVALSESYQPLGPPVAIELPLSTDDFIGGWTSDNKVGLLLKTVARGAIYTIAATGGIASQLTPTFANSPKWSPDGESIYYIADTAVYTLPSRGGQAQIVPITAAASEFTYYHDLDISPDGQRLAFSGATKGDSTVNIFTVSVNGGEPLRLTSDSTSDEWTLSWSPDGDWIAYMRTDPKFKRRDLCLVPADGGEIRQLVFSSDSCKLWDGDQLAWSPDGRFIAFRWTRGDSMVGISVTPFDGGKSEIITQLEADYNLTSLCWSPDGKKLIYGSGVYEYGDLRGYVSILNLDTRRSVKLRTGMGLEGVSSIDWSPDGDLIAFSCNWYSLIELWMMENFLPDEPTQR